jgi:Ca2+-binding RTX toxin-like protein
VKRVGSVRLGIAGALLVCLAAEPVLTAANTVAPSSAGSNQAAIGANDLKPPEAAALTLTTLRTGSLTVIGTAGADLVLGSASLDTLSGAGSGDALIGGGAADILDGGAGADVCIGGPGIDTFLGCETQIQ